MADEDRMTRRQYRRRQTETKPDDDDSDYDDQSGSTSASRQAYAAENNRALEEAKTKRLARKLNWVILGLVLGIIAVFLILFLTP